jgi:hypothetical protein
MHRSAYSFKDREQVNLATFFIHCLPYQDSLLWGEQDSNL